MAPPPTTFHRLASRLKGHPLKLAAALLAAGIAAGAAGAYAYLVGPLLKAVLLAQPLRWHGRELDAHQLLWALPAVLVGVAAIKAAAQWLHVGWMQALGQGLLAKLREDLYAHLLCWPPLKLERHSSGDLLSRLTTDLGQLEFLVTQALASYVKDGLTLVVLAGVCAAIDWRLFLVAFVALPLAILPVARFARAAKRAARSTQSSLGRLTGMAAEAVQNLPVIQSYGAANALLDRFDAEQRVYHREVQRSLLVRGAFTPVLETMGFWGVAAVIAFGSRAVAHEPQLAAQLLSFLTAALLMYQPLKALSGTFSQATQGLAAAERLFALEDPLVLHVAQGPAKPPAQRLSTALALEQLEVGYGGAPVLRGLSLSVPAGRSVALVGASGAGKSTAFAALLGFAPVGSGRILWDGQDCAGLDPASLRRQVGWVAQEPILFSGTVRQNLILAAPAAGEPALWEALRRAHAESFVRGFPRGLEEPVGERGSRLSGGQRQRIAIARALLRDPSLLLLDEPTSALDAASEAEVQAGLEELMRGRTTLFIAHRLATVARADLIYVLDQGVVVESGDHARLSATAGRYAELLRQGALAAALGQDGRRAR